METTRRNLAAGNDSKTILTTPRFDERAEETARPVVPLGRVANANGFARPQHGMRGMILALVLAAFVGAAVAAVIYRGTGTTAPSPAPQTSSEAATAGAASEPAIEATKTQPVRPEVRGASSEAPVETEARGSLPVDGESEKPNRKEEVRRERDEEKIAERASKQEKKQAKRERKEAERIVERGRDSEKGGETRPRLVGIYTEKPKP